MDWIKKFQFYLHEQGKADKTIESYTGDIRGYFGYIADRGITFDGTALLFHLETKPKYLRDKVMVQLLLYTGVRVSELVGIRINDIDFLSYHLKVVGKGGRFREIPLKQEVVITIKKYLVERQNNPYSDSDYLLLGQRGAIGRDAVNRVLVRITKEAKLPQKLKPHTFRHHFCTRLIHKGVPLTTVAKLAGHASIETTSKFYIGCSRQEKMDAVNLL